MGGRTMSCLKSCQKKVTLNLFLITFILFILILGNSEIYFCWTDRESYYCRAILVITNVWIAGSISLPKSTWLRLSLKEATGEFSLTISISTLAACMPCPFSFLLLALWKEVIIYYQTLDLLLSESTTVLLELSSTTTVLWAGWSHSHWGETSPGVDFIAPLIAVA